ncbi:MAG: acyl-CoA dehydrogenase family protein [Acidimicrobiales bacterium]
MEFAVPEEIEMLLASVRSFIDREVRPLEQEHRELVEEGIVTPEFYALTREVTHRSVKAGLYALAMPEDVGGGGLGELWMCLLREEVARSGTFLTLNMLGDIPFGPNRMLYALASPGQRERYLLPLVRGEVTTAMALTEPEAGSDLASVQTAAVRVGDAWSLRGAKHFITNAPYADFVTVLARTGKGHSFFLVDSGTPGFHLGRIQRTMGGDDIQCELFFEDCLVPALNLIGEPGLAFEYAMRFLGNERLAIASTALGIADYLIELGVEHAKTRVQFGRPIGANQAIQWMLADSITELRAARNLCYEAAWRADQGEDVFQQVAMAKLFATEMVGRVVDRVLQVHGGVGYVRGSPVERFYRLVRVLRIGGGTSEIQRMIIAHAAGL